MGRDIPGLAAACPVPPQSLPGATPNPDTPGKILTSGDGLAIPAASPLNLCFLTLFEPF